MHIAKTDKGVQMNTQTYQNQLNVIASTLNINMRNFSNLRDIDKAMIVSACLLCIKFKEDGLFDFSCLSSDEEITDGAKLYSLLADELANIISDEATLTIIMNCFLCVKQIESINHIHSKLGTTPIKYFLQYLDENLVSFCKEHNLNDDYLGLFYTLFMKYSSDSKHLGVVVTPAYIMDLCADLINLNASDIIIDPCCGTGSFLISSFINKEVGKSNLYGYDIEPHMFTITITNLILRGCRPDHIACRDFLETPSSLIKDTVRATVGFMNPPYAQGKKDASLSEIFFVKHLLDSLTAGARCAVIVPAATFVDSKQTNCYKFDIYKHHTLEGIITLNPNTFYGVATNSVIAIFTAHQPHPTDKLCKFIDFKDDGYINHPHTQRIYTPEADIKKEYLLKVWNNEIKSDASFCIQTTVQQDDEWLFNFYHANLNIPNEKVFEEKVNNYLTFHFNMILNGRSDLFQNEPEKGTYVPLEELQNKKWGVFQLGEDFIISGAKITNEKKLMEGNDIPRITTSKFDNGYEDFYSKILSNGKMAKLNAGQVVTIETASKGTTFYQPSDFISNPHLITIKFKEREMNQYTGLFLSACISSAIDRKYFYGYKFSLFRILKEKIILPITKNGEIDYDYMEQYCKNLFIKKNDIVHEYGF